MTREFPVEAGHIMMFARAIGDPNPVYHDAEYAPTTEVGGIIAPPTFVAAAAHYDPEYSLRPKPGQAWFGSGKNSTGTPDRQRAGNGSRLHAEQHYEYHQPIRPGDILSVRSHQGGTWQKQSRNGGTLLFREMVTEYFNPAGELVLRARSVSVETQRRPEAEH